MSQSISEFTTEELKNDLAETKADIILCEKALALGITEYSDGDSVQHRLDVNLKIERMIEGELEFRKAQSTRAAEFGELA